MAEKIQKVLANSGVASRREIERWLQEGRICVNGQLAHLGQRIELTAHVAVDGKTVCLLAAPEKVRLLLYNKPLGEVCSRRDEQNRRTVFANLPAIAPARWIIVGRLDINSQGLVLFTDSGELAHGLMHPSYQVNRTYRVRVFGTPTAIDLQQLKKGVELAEGWSRFEKIIPLQQSGQNAWFEVSLSQGRNREVRRMWQALGYQVNRLIRIAYGAACLPKHLSAGHWQQADKQLIEKILQCTLKRAP